MTDENLTRSAGSAAFWQLFGGGASAFIRLTASIFLARLLTPHDFGIFGMALLAYEFVSYAVSCAGIGSAIVAKKEVTQADLSTSFWSIALVKFVMFLLAFLGAPLAGEFWKSDEIVPVLQVISFTFLISALDSVSNTLLIKRLKFKTINIINVVICLLESVGAVILAYTTDLGYWSLVITMLAGSFVTALLMFVLAGWQPSLEFDKRSFKYQFRFGINGLGFSIVNYLNQNLDYLIVGRMLGTSALGLYEFAYRIPHLLQLRVVQPIGNALFPLLAKVQDDDDKLITGYAKAAAILSFITFPLLVGLAAVADILVPLMWGEQWVSIVIPLQILCASALLRVVPQASGAVLLNRNRPDLPFKISVLSLLITAALLFFLGQKMQLNGVALAMTLGTIPHYLGVYYAFKLTNGKVGYLLSQLAPVIVASIVCGGMAMLTKEMLMANTGSMLFALFAAILVGALSYLIVLVYLFSRFFKGILTQIDAATGVSLVSRFAWLYRWTPLKD
ncbi:lipopolysaccharide biosynthesis protein [Gayadomonas joobiniege]|uniref:lipopolysaccharide biosynthesis protein n=1 Tax=Gayadomonas joobiniege TaxID=1234606 RepID=UPI0003680DFC|nr:lipopolysaccharide biosynthesis protein [Gayadomonas joobiniege]